MAVRTFDEELVSDGSDDGVLRTADVTRVVSAVLHVQIYKRTRAHSFLRTVDKQYLELYLQDSVFIQSIFQGEKFLPNSKLCFTPYDFINHGSRVILSKTSV